MHDNNCYLKSKIEEKINLLTEVKKYHIKIHTIVTLSEWKCCLLSKHLPLFLICDLRET